MKKLFTKLFGKLDKPYALPIEGCCHEPGAYTWEDWERDNQKTYPFRYWLHETMPMWFRVHVSMNIENIWYWIRTHTYNRYHLLDLRSDVGIVYKWGWIENDTAMMLSCFNILRKFVEVEKGLASLSWDFENDEWWKEAGEKERKVYINQRNDMNEIKTLYDWWMKEREREHYNVNGMYGYDRKLVLDIFNDGRTLNWLEAMDELDKKDDLMLEKLIKYRHYLWT
jgi:hypothetical protein